MESGQVYDAVVIGGGLAGTTVCAELALLAPAGFRALLIESREPGPGTAYAAPSDELYMNGTAAAMSAVPGDERHLMRWMRSTNDAALISRRLFGRYLRERFRDTAGARTDFEVASTEAVDIEKHDGRLIVVDAQGRRRLARSVVLAVGNFPPNSAMLPPAIRRFHSFVADPWRLPAAFDTHGGDALLVGSGLTALDVVALLDERGFAGHLHLVSRHGLLPEAENPFARALDPKMMQLDTATPLALLRTLRAAARRHISSGGDWRDAIEAIRAASPGIWVQWPLHERRRFLRHLQSFWAVHRYRVPAKTAAVCDRLLRQGRLSRYRGRVTGAAIANRGLQVILSNAEGTTAIEVFSVINCTGPDGDYARIDRPLVANLVRQGLIRPDPLHLGLDATTDLQVVDRSGVANEHMYAIGPPLRGVLYETTAVPETRDQAGRIARAIVEKIPQATLRAVS